MAGKAVGLNQIGKAVKVKRVLLDIRLESGREIPTTKVITPLLILDYIPVGRT